MDNTNSPPSFKVSYANVLIPNGWVKWMGQGEVV